MMRSGLWFLPQYPYNLLVLCGSQTEFRNPLDLLVYSFPSLTWERVIRDLLNAYINIGHPDKSEWLHTILLRPVFCFEQYLYRYPIGNNKRHWQSAKHPIVPDGIRPVFFPQPGWLPSAPAGYKYLVPYNC